MTAPGKLVAPRLQGCPLGVDVLPRSTGLAVLAPPTGPPQAPEDRAPWRESPNPARGNL